MSEIKERLNDIEELIQGLGLKDMDLPPEFLDVYTVMIPGAAKHGSNAWLDTDNKAMDRKANHASMSRHLAEGYMGRLEDPDTLLHPYLHLACRALMAYTRYKRDIDDTAV